MELCKSSKFLSHCVQTGDHGIRAHEMAVVDIERHSADHNNLTSLARRSRMRGEPLARARRASNRALAMARHGRRCQQPLRRNARPSPVRAITCVDRPALNVMPNHFTSCVFRRPMIAVNDHQVCLVHLTMRSVARCGGTRTRPGALTAPCFGCPDADALRTSRRRADGLPR